MELKSAIFVDILDNFIADVSRKPAGEGSEDSAPIKVTNIFGKRATTNIKIHRNMIQNTTPDRFARYGIRLGSCVVAPSGCFEQRFFNIDLPSPGDPGSAGNLNTFLGMRRVPVCIVKTPTPDFEGAFDIFLPNLFHPTIERPCADQDQ